MERKELENIGLEKDAIDKVLNLHHAEIDPLRTEVKEKDTEINTLKTSTKETQSKIEELSKKAEGNDDLRQAFEDLKKEAEEKESKYKGEIDRRDFEKVLTDEITKRGGKALVKKLISYEEFKESNDRTSDIAKKLEEMKLSDETKILFEPTKLDEKNVGGEDLGKEETDPKKEMPTYF